MASRLQDGEPDYAFDCLVYENLSLQEEAAIYLAQDDERLRHSVADDFPAMLVNDDPVAKGVQRCLDAVGLEVAPYGEAGHKKNRVRCVSALLNAYETNGEYDLTRALELLRDEWGEEEHHPANPKKSIYAESTVNSLPAFLRLYSGPAQRPLDYPWLRKAMRRDGPGGLGAGLAAPPQRVRQQAPGRASPSCTGCWPGSTCTTAPGGRRTAWTTCSPGATATPCGAAPGG